MSSAQQAAPTMAIQLGELLTNTKGGKSVPLRGEGSGPPVWQSAEVQKIGGGGVGGGGSVVRSNRHRPLGGPRGTGRERA